MKLCRTCRQCIGGQHSGDGTVSSENSLDSSGCFVCLGLWQNDGGGNDDNDGAGPWPRRLADAIRVAAEPYGGIASNRFSRGEARLVVPGDVVHRYRLAAAQVATAPPARPMPVAVFVDRLRKHAMQQLQRCLEGFEQASGPQLLADYPDCVPREEQGHLGLHVILAPRPGVPRPLDLAGAGRAEPAKRTRRQRQAAHLDVTQGGDPRVNLQERIERLGPSHVVWTLNQALASGGEPSRFDTDILKGVAGSGNDSDTSAFTFYVAIWRKPFYFGAKYTKSRRDVSQTPFFVNEASSSILSASSAEEGSGRKRRRLGVTSVEEQIVSVMERHIGGVSRLNEQPTPLPNHASSKRQFGMVKFHASGREDMNVRMLLPAKADATRKISGRPFVCEVIDALRLPTREDLERIVNEINHANIDGAEESMNGNGENALGASRSYGKNPLGVDISDDLTFVNGSAYSNLQAETEEKVKHYACHCWSQLPFTLEQLRSRLDDKFPLSIQQRTPIRVLHRRVNMTRTRHVLSCSAERIDDHHFTLHISTDAGAYVKEWCHSDLGRTSPSLSDLLGCKTDILELDCEGIEL